MNPQVCSIVHAWGMQQMPSLSCYENTGLADWNLSLHTILTTTQKESLCYTNTGRGPRGNPWAKAMSCGHCPSATSSVLLGCTDIATVICLLGLSLINFHNLKLRGKTSFCLFICFLITILYPNIYQFPVSVTQPKACFEPVHSAFKWCFV